MKTPSMWAGRKSIHDVVGVEVALLAYVVHPFAALFGFSGEDGGEVFVVAVWVVGYL